MTSQTPDPATTPRCPLPGSDRGPAPDASAAAPLDPNEEISITLILRRRNPLPEEAMTEPIPRERFIAEYGADPADIELVTNTLTEFGIRIDQADPGSRRIRVTGPLGTLSQLFGTELQRVTSTAPSGDQVTHRYRTGELSMPVALGDVVTAVLGLDDRPQTRA